MKQTLFQIYQLYHLKLIFKKYLYKCKKQPNKFQKLNNRYVILDLSLILI
jgi:hypothetical protein